MTEDGIQIVAAISNQTTSVTGSVYGYITDSTNLMQTNLAVWASLFVGAFVGLMIARGIVDPWRK